ncbi:apolipoprotein N-acyltransferase [Muribacter muris]|uniref:Apolipoprotein N-acyltransferase n=1 Tax=Muribacter muris TaxID=67855 RepID=A0A4Y9K4F2_9PAST|nr:apolipoprotein N-acyltransferase [Muribacter muris]MBF0784200.1 apolipoprotein N-acyltransferase [Muribacter muris]MBF0827171.1 apolipoprotein N-acyltransferase [Muribacter muris]TFV12944.1 apolipoprotein N-acyltransferase [Muribacter muris]
MMIAKKSSFLASCLSLMLGGIGVLAYSPFDYWGVSFLSAFGLIWLATQPHQKGALLSVFLWGLSYFAVGVNWVQVSMIQFGGVPEVVSYLAVVLLAAYLALYPLLFGYLSQRFKLTNPWILASLFTLTEYLREVVFTGFPWLQFGYSLIDSPFARLAQLFGVEGLTFFVILTSGYLVQIFRHFTTKQHNLTACFSLCIIVIFAWTSRFVQFVEVDNSKPPVTISLIQGNIEQKMKWDPAYFNETLQTYQRLIGQVLGKSEVIILPESAIPALESQIEPLLNQLQIAAAEKGSELIIGTLHQSERGLFNSAVVVGNPEMPYALASSPRYNKHHLVPFGEYVPFGSLLDWMREVFVLPINLSQGDYIQSPLIAGKRRFNLAICYEIIYGEQVQQNQKAGNADYLLTISNDAWFGTSIGPWQHFQMARMRALELGKPLVRSTNTGVTAFIDENGKLIAQLPQFEADTLTATLHSTVGKTWFAEFGRWLIWAICAVVILIGWGKRLRGFQPKD